MSQVLRDGAEITAAERAGIGLGPGPTAGLALSGGGIRSASVCLGVLQALHCGKLLEKFHYLSTVSGGGYIGSTITWLNNRQDGGISLLDRFAGLLRARGNFLDPSRRLSLTSLAALVLRVVTINAGFYIGVLVALFVGALQLGAFCGPAVHGIVVNPILKASGLLGGAFFGLSFLYAVSTGFAWHMVARLRYWARREAQVFGGALLTAIVLLALVGLLPTAALALETELAKRLAAASGFGGLIVGAVTTGIKAWKDLAGDRSGSVLDSPWKVTAIAAAAIYGSLVIAYMVATEVAASQDWATILWVMAAALAALGYWTNINLMSLHRMYRDRIMEAFQPNPADIKTDVDHWTAATDANTAQLTGMGKLPYHLINTNIILTESRVLKTRGRGGDNYILSPYFCGSQSTGWHPTKAVFPGKDGLTLATAVAISGAAVNAHTGSDGQGGIMRDGAVSFLMTLFGLQLGYWVNNPGRFAAFHRPCFLIPGLPALLGARMFQRTSAFHMLSDGGHFDNTGIYELLRREVDTILCVDASQDVNHRFEDLTALIEKARADFGVTISFSGEPLDNLVPSQPCPWFPGVKVAKRGWIEGVIQYPAKKDDLAKSGCCADKVDRGKTGRLIYVKSTLLSTLSADVFGYAVANPTFPNQSTGDQFFDEVQLESYRSVGCAIAQGIDETIFRPGSGGGQVAAEVVQPSNTVTA